MPDQAYTITPEISVGANGEQVTGFSVEGSDHRTSAIDQFQYEQNNLMYRDQEGVDHHRFELSEQESMQLDDSYFEEESAEEYLEGTPLTDEDTDYLQSIAGGS